MGNGINYPLNNAFYNNNGKSTGINVSSGEKTELTDGKMYGDSISFMPEAVGPKMLHTGKYFAILDSIGLNIS